MEFGKHFDKGVWAVADKALPVFSGVVFVVLVIRVLPEVEFGNFTLIQELFLIISGLATAFVLQPMLKFAAEEGNDYEAVLSSAVIMNLAFVFIFSVLVVIFRIPLGILFNSPNLPSLMLWIPAMLGASFMRNFTLVLLQARFHIKQIFVVDAVHFIGSPILIYMYSKLHIFDSAFDLITINIISLSASSFAGMVASRSMLRFSVRVSPGVMKKMWDYGKYTLGGLVSYMVYAKADTFILSSFGGPIQVATYNSVKVLVRVYDVASQIVSMFILPVTSKLASKREFKTLKIVVEKALAFSTIGMLPVFIFFLVFASPLIGVVYQGRYGDAVPLLQIFSLLSLIVPATAVAGNTIMGLGHARLGFLLGLVILFASIIMYLIFIPWLGTLGATIGYVATSFVLAWVMVAQMNRFVPVSFGEVLRRTNDIKVFILSHLRR